GGDGPVADLPGAGLDLPSGPAEGGVAGEAGLGGVAAAGALQPRAVDHAAVVNDAPLGLDPGAVVAGLVAQHLVEVAAHHPCALLGDLFLDHPHAPADDRLGQAGDEDRPVGVDVDAGHHTPANRRRP